MEYLQQNRFRIEAIVYGTRKGAPDMVKKLLKTVFFVIQVTKHIISRQKQLDYWCLKQRIKSRVCSRIEDVGHRLATPNEGSYAVY